MATQTSLFFMVCLARGHQDLEAMVAGPNRSRFINISLAIGFLSHPLVASAPEKISKCLCLLSGIDLGKEYRHTWAPWRSFLVKMILLSIFPGRLNCTLSIRSPNSFPATGIRASFIQLFGEKHARAEEI